MRRSSPRSEPTRARASFAFGVIEALEYPVFAFDAAGVLTLMNGAARALCGWPDGLRAASTGCDLRFRDKDGCELVPGAAPWERVLAGRGAVREHLLVISRGGEPCRVEVSATPLLDSCGEIVGAVMSVGELCAERTIDTQVGDYASDLEMLTEVSRMLAELQDPDDAASVICTVATGATGAIAVLLWELVDDELLMYRHEGGLGAEELRDMIDHSRAGAERAMSDARTVVESSASDCVDDAGPGSQRDTATGPVRITVWHEPLTSSARVMGVLSILWMGFLEDLDRPSRLIGPLALHAATALERASLLRRLNELARTDPLTGLANRRVWEETLERELARAARESQPLSLVLIDIDHFKRYNDTRGHPQGDRLLHDAARAWSQRLRSTDLLARVGGEEFAVLLPVCPPEDARVVAERLRRSVPDGQTCSLGVVTSTGLASASELYAAADTALYRAKANGRNRAETGHLTDQHEADQHRNAGLHDPRTVIAADSSGG